MKLSNFLVGLDIIMKYYDPEELHVSGIYTEDVYVNKVDGPLIIPKEDAIKLQNLGWRFGAMHRMLEGAWIAPPY